MRVRRRWICSVWLRRPYPVAPGQEGYPDDIQQLDSMHSEEDEDT